MEAATVVKLLLGFLKRFDFKNFVVSILVFFVSFVNYYCLDRECKLVVILAYK